MAAKKLLVRQAHYKRAIGRKVKGKDVIMETFIFGIFEEVKKEKKKE